MKKFTFEDDPNTPGNTVVTVHVNKYEKWVASFRSPVTREQARHTWANNETVWTQKIGQ